MLLPQGVWKQNNAGGRGDRTEENTQAGKRKEIRKDSFTMPYLMIETDYSKADSGQINTRL